MAKRVKTSGASERIAIPDSVRTRVLLANRHACCICQKIDVQIHHIDGDNSNNVEDNLAVLCLPHHDKATAPPTLTAKLRPGDVKIYKASWEAMCADESARLARSRTAFFMVDYKNADRIRQLFAQLTSQECLHAYVALTDQFQEEDKLRKEQHFDISLEPNTSWNSATRVLLEFVKRGEVHPSRFRQCDTHPLDALYPRGFFDNGEAAFAYYDLWCQIMVRAILAAKGSYDIGDLMRVKDLSCLSLAGRLISFSGSLRGNVAFPDTYARSPVSKTVLTVQGGMQTWRTELLLKTHYVYSTTAASSLSKGRSNGLLIMRGIERIKVNGRRRIVEFSCTPLMTGCGGGGPLDIPTEAKI
jgi:hypothetical protein